MDAGPRAVMLPLLLVHKLLDRALICIVYLIGPSIKYLLKHLQSHIFIV